LRRVVVRHLIVGLAATIFAGPMATRAWAQQGPEPGEAAAPAAAPAPAPEQTITIEPPAPDAAPLSAAASPPPTGDAPPPTAGDAPAAEAALPGFMTLDRMDGSTRFGVQVGFHKLDRLSLSDGFAMRYEPYLQYVVPDRVAGVYGQVPIAHLFDLTGADGTGIGNLELGGFYMPLRNSSLILRAGLVFETASEDGPEQLALAIVAFERLTDLLQVQPNYSTARVSLSTVQMPGPAFYRADIGFDVIIDKPNTADTSLFLRANFAAGVRVPGVDLAAELVNLGVLDGTVSGGVSNRFVHTLALTARTPGVNQVHVGTVFPLDDGARGEVWILSAGYQRAMN
jgi:hypothetical protein